MKPALRKQLFERWKEIGSDVDFNEFIFRFEALSRGRVHVKIDGIEGFFILKTAKLPLVFFFAGISE